MPFSTDTAPAYLGATCPSASAIRSGYTLDADERVLNPLAAAGKTPVIPPKGNRKKARDFDRHLFKARQLIENFFARLKQYRAIATRYDKTARNVFAAVHLAAAVIWLN